MRTGRALVFTNGPQFNAPAVHAMIREDDYLIAADGGLHHLQALGMQPNLVIGDLDSVEPGDIEALKNSRVRVAQFPVHKDETDLELALEAALREGYQTILILGALGGRLDMTLANIFLLDLPELAGRDVRLEDGLEEVFLIHAGPEGAKIQGQPDDIVSLLPLGGPAEGIRTEGLYYPLRNETMLPERTRGVSNRLIETEARVTLAAGRLICIHTRQFPKNNHLSKETRG